MTDSGPVIAIQTPTYNRADRLPAAIESVRSQTYPHWRMLIVDDGSTDHTPDIVAPYVKADPRIVYLTCDANRGHLAARNVGLDHLPPEVTWLTELDSDDVFLPEALEVMTGIIERYPDVRSFKLSSRSADGTSIGESVVPGRSAGYEDRLLKRSPRGAWVNLTHRCFTDDGLRYDERLRRTPSVGFSLHLARMTPAYYFPDVVRVMDRTTVSITRPAAKDVAHFRELVRVHEVFLETFGSDLRALSPALYSKRLSKYAEHCACAGQMGAAWRHWFKAVVRRPWSRVHLETLRVMLRRATRSFGS